MDFEEKIVKLRWKDGKFTEELLEIYEEAPDDEDFVLLKMKLTNEVLSVKSENCFQALEQLRQYLEQMNIQIQCNGAALNVYPSPMALSMGVGRKAYILSLGRRAKTDDLVDIFECDEDLKFVTINEQLKFYKDWSNSL
ncbi:hypothetical protein QNH39_25670 [Neobacillus novalis]|uniref:Uncharacterized protein n=1 Tax=Neobacillus novalis TaxID=220687 RepID=A0AA95ML30_9BACI|nr:hypothetical protein [Neobacillus novalis]WHY85924.1 hypothetical protein QNH39_25670 [Neobacillus novalis]